MCSALQIYPHYGVDSQYRPCQSKIRNITYIPRASTFKWKHLWLQNHKYTDTIIFFLSVEVKMTSCELVYILRIWKILPSSIEMCKEVILSFLHCGSIYILDRIILCSEDVLCILGCLAVSLVSALLGGSSTFPPSLVMTINNIPRHC